MSRLTTRKRWLMAGPWPHPRTGILYYRKATPPDLWAERARLGEHGIAVKREVHRSLGTKDQRPAEQRYVQIAAQQEEEWERWRDLLRNGPQPLSHKQLVGLAADYAKAFLATHEDDPFSAPPAPSVPPFVNLPAEPSLREAVALEAVTLIADGDANLVADFMEVYRTEGDRGRELGLAMLDNHPRLTAVLRPFMVAYLEAMHGPDTGRALHEQGLNVDPETRTKINLEMVRLLGAAREGLAARQGGDYGPVPQLERAPAFVPTRKPATQPQGMGAGSTEGSYPSLIFLLHHKAKKKSLRPNTVRDDEGYLRKFIKFVGFDDARRVERRDVREWRDSLIAQTDPPLSSRTIRNKYLSGLKAALQHGVDEFDLSANVAAGITDEREGAAPTRSSGWTEGEAVAILSATFRGSSRGISMPHRRAVFWAPWIMAYTGLRVGEVTQLHGRDLKVADGIPHLIVTPASGGTKSNRAWATGIHAHLIELGLLEFIGQMGDGPLFYEPLKDGQPLTVAERRSRVQDAYQAVTDWVKDELGMEAPLGRPNHAWRHLFTSRSRLCGMDKEARDFMLGSRSKTDAREGYGDWPPLVLDREINKQPRFPVVDTGWRPINPNASSKRLTSGRL